MKLPRWTREPLAHFLLAGAFLWLILALRGEAVDPASRTIAVDRETQAQIALGFERLMRRPPTDAELDRQIDRYVREEVLYREALRLGLDRDDAVVRRRLAQKMDQLATARAQTVTPSDQTLRAYYEDNADRFARDLSVSFDQLHFRTESAARTASGAISAGSDWQELGSEISLPTSVEAMPLREVSTRFGAQFASALRDLAPAPRWHGPVPSGYGWHLVRLRESSGLDIAPFEEVRGAVENEWRAATIAEREEEAYRLLRDAYTVEIAR